MPAAQSRRATGWIDISVPLKSGMVHWPSDPPVRIDRVKALERGDHSTLSRLAMSAHAGTHVDAPLHFIRGAQGLEAMPLAATIGPARVLEIRNPRVVEPEELSRHRIRRGERILLKTRNSTRCWTTDAFVQDFVSLSLDAARLFASAGVRVVGIDYLSVGPYQGDGAAIHRTLLGAGVWIIEGLNLASVVPGRYTLICLPLKIPQGDGAPARAILRPLSRRAGGRLRAASRLAPRP